MVLVETRILMHLTSVNSKMYNKVHVLNMVLEGLGP